MEILTPSVRIELPATQLLALDRAQRVRIACQTGRLWITDEGSGDIVLAAGECYTARGKHLVVIEALRDSVVMLENLKRGRRAAAGMQNRVVSRSCAASLRA